MNNKLCFLLPFRCIIFLLILIIGAVITEKSLDEISNFWSVAATAVNILTILLLVLISGKIGGSFKKLINYERGETKLKQAVFMTAVVLLVGVGGMFLSGFICYGVIPYAPPMLIEPVAMPLAVMNIILLPVSTALAEEGLYLKYHFVNMLSGAMIPVWFFPDWLQTAVNCLPFVYMFQTPLGIFILPPQSL